MKQRVLLDLFCGRWGWSRAFAARGWRCYGVDLVPTEGPSGCEHWRCDVLEVTTEMVKNLGVDFIVASSPCEQFSVWGMRHFHANPPHPTMGIKLFAHTQGLCEESGVPYVMENVRAAQQFVGKAVHHCGPFYLWGTGVPPLLHRGIGKGIKMDREWCQKLGGHGSAKRNSQTADFATIPPELSSCVADYAERLLEQKPNRASWFRCAC